MTLRVAEQWKQFFTAAVSCLQNPKVYITFVTNCITETTLPVLLEDYLIDLGVTIIGDILAIIRHVKSLSQPSSEATLTTIISSVPTMSPYPINKQHNRQTILTPHSLGATPH